MNALLRKLGWIPSLPDIRDKPYARARAVEPGTLPKEIRLVQMPMPLDQGPLNACVANAVANAVNYCRQAQHSLYAFHPSRLFNYYVSRKLKGWEGFDSGDYVRDGIKCTNSFGSVTEDQWPYDPDKLTEEPPRWVYDSAVASKSLVYYRLDMPGMSPAERIHAIKVCLAENFPVVFGFAVYSNFPWNDPFGEVMMPKAGDWTSSGHGALICESHDSTDRFTFQSSWGMWAKMGRGTLPFEYLGEGGLSSDFWTIRSVQDESNP